MKSMEIYYDDLNDEAKKEFDDVFGPPESFNHEISPLAIYEQEDDPCENCRKCGENTCPGDPAGDKSCFEER